MFRWSQIRMVAIAGAAALFVFSAARADVTIKQTMKMSGLGGILDSETKMVTRVQGDRRAEDSEMKLTNKMMKLFGGGKPVKTTSIIRLDRDPAVFLNVDHQSKTVTEMTVAEMRAMMDSAAGMLGGGMTKDMPGSKPAYDTSEVTFSPPKIDVKKTGAKETIGGHACEQSILTMEIEGTNRKTGESFKLLTVMDMMLAQNVPGKAEEDAFNRRMAEELGFTMEKGQSSAQAMMGMMKMYGIDPEDLTEAAAKLEGFPMRQTITFRGEGDQFAPAQPPSGQEEAESEEGDDGSSATSAQAAAAKALGGLFGKKKDKEEKPVETGPPSIFSATITVDEITTGSVAADSFDPPKNYKVRKAGE